MAPEQVVEKWNVTFYSAQGLEGSQSTKLIRTKRG